MNYIDYRGNPINVYSQQSCNGQRTGRQNNQMLHLFLRSFYTYFQYGNPISVRSNSIIHSLGARTQTSAGRTCDRNCDLFVSFDIARTVCPRLYAPRVQLYKIYNGSARVYTSQYHICARDISYKAIVICLIFSNILLLLLQPSLGKNIIGNQIDKQTNIFGCIIYLISNTLILMMT